MAEAAVVGFPHDIKGQGIYAFVTLMTGVAENEEVNVGILESVKKDIGPHAKPDKIQYTPALPKTRSGKIMRRILRKIAEGDTGNMGDIETGDNDTSISDKPEKKDQFKDRLKKLAGI